MKLAHPDIDNNIIIEDGEVFELIIENHSLFYSVISDIALQIQKADGKTILSKDNKPISISSNVEFITDYVFFDLNQKTLLTKILSYLEKRALDSNHYSKQQELLGKIECFINDLIFDFSCDMEITTLNMASLLKASGLKIIDDYRTLEEKLAAYMELTDEFMGDRLYILVNLKSYLSNKALNLLLNDASSHNRKVLLIDNHGEIINKANKHLIIDEDLCEI